jgi:hypothetical protein
MAHIDGEIVINRPMEMSTELTGYERPRRLASTTGLSMMAIRGTVSFDPVPGGTRMRWSWDLEPRGPLKLMSPLVTRIGARGEQAIWTSLKHLLEAREAPASAARG